MNERFQLLGHYPGDGTETRDEVFSLVDRQHVILLDTPMFADMDSAQRFRFADKMMTYFAIADEWFKEEKVARERGDNPYFNLYYHDINHARQAKYDGSAIINHVIMRNPELGPHLDLKGVTAIHISNPHHDNAYVKPRHPVESLAKNLPDHPAESADNTCELIDTIGLPDGTDPRVVKIMVRIGILGTTFPMNDKVEAEIKKLMHELELHDQKQAEIVRRNVSLADSGQNSRCHQLFLLPGLQQEFDCYEKGKGTREIGIGIEQIAKNSEYFVQNFLKPMIDQPARWLYGTTNHPFAQEWNKLGPNRLLLKNPIQHFCRRTNASRILKKAA